jgi:serine/threonine-protein kinase RsbT
MRDCVTVAIACDADIAGAGQRGRELAGHLAFPAGDQTVIAAAIAEIGRNIVRYADRGEMEFRVVENGDNSALTVIARDAGPGIADVELAMQDGYSTKDGLGLGLAGASRLMDEFEINSAPGAGTTVTMKKWRAVHG